MITLNLNGAEVFQKSSKLQRTNNANAEENSCFVNILFTQLDS